MSYTNRQLAKLNNRLGGGIHDLNGNRVVQFANGSNSGSILGADIGVDISYIEYNLATSEGMSFTLGDSNAAELFFVYTSKGKVNYRLNANKAANIEELQTVILGGKNSSLEIMIPESQETKFAIIRIVEMQEDSNMEGDFKLNKQVFNRFLGTVDTINYRGTFNLKIKEQLSQIAVIRQIGLVRTLLIKGILHFILALEINQYDLDMRNKSEGLTKLTRSELMRVAKASSEIESTPEYPFTVVYLSRKFGLSPAKLQEGFRFSNNTTVANFIRVKRLEKAERLLRNSGMNVSEVVYTIGFTSRSYFSKIFKKKYDCSPRNYQKQCARSIVQPVI